MNLYKIPTYGLKTKKKCSFPYGSLFLFVLLIISPGVCRPPEETLDDFDIGEEYGDVDNLELHHVKIVNGTPFEDYKIIMYKEDFVSEDYNSEKNHTNIVAVDEGLKNSRKPTPKYKDIPNRRELKRSEIQPINALKSEKIYFDVLPQSPVTIGEDDIDTNTNGSKFDPSKIRVDVISLIDDVDDNTSIKLNEKSKQMLSKHPKKYRPRFRRSTENHHTIQKRNSYYYQGPQVNEGSNFFKHFFSVMKQSLNLQPIYNRYVVPGKFWNGINHPVLEPDNDISVKIQRRGNEDDNERDRIVWGSSRKTPSRASPNRIPTPTRRPAPPLFHDSNPENADWSFTTKRPLSNEQGSTMATPADASTAEFGPNDLVITKCVWAIVNCCSNRDYNVRYNCFEQLGCSGAFWGLNPCADNIKDNVINYVSGAYD